MLVLPMRACLTVYQMLVQSTMVHSCAIFLALSRHCWLVQARKSHGMMKAEVAAARQEMAAAVKQDAAALTAQVMYDAPAVAELM
jgi:hypothetical protein